MSGGDEACDAEGSATSSRPGLTIGSDARLVSMQGGFSLFGPDHLAALGAVCIACVACIVVTRRGSPSCGRGIRWLVAVTLASAHATESLVAWWQGCYTRDMLPLQLCDVAAMLAVWGLLTLDQRAIEPLHFFALSGTAPALFTPELDVAFPHLRFVVYFVEHGLTVIAPLLLAAGLGCRPRPGAWRRAVLQVNALAGVAALANLTLRTNFLYLSRKPVGPTPFDLFGPWPNYLLVLEVLVLVIFRLLQAITDATHLSRWQRPQQRRRRQPRETSDDHTRSDARLLRCAARLLLTSSAISE